MAKQVIFLSKRRCHQRRLLVRIDKADQDRAFFHRVDHIQRRWLHGEDHVGIFDQSVAIAGECDILERRIDQAGSVSSARLHVQLGAQLGQLADDGRHQRHAPFVGMCFLQNGDVDVHEALQLLCRLLAALADWMDLCRATQR